MAISCGSAGQQANTAIHAVDPRGVRQCQCESGNISTPLSSQTGFERTLPVRSVMQSSCRRSWQAQQARHRAGSSGRIVKYCTYRDETARSQFVRVTVDWPAWTRRARQRLADRLGQIHAKTAAARNALAAREPLAAVAEQLAAFAFGHEIEPDLVGSTCSVFVRAFASDSSTSSVNSMTQARNFVPTSSSTFEAVTRRPRQS